MRSYSSSMTSGFTAYLKHDAKRGFVVVTVLVGLLLSLIGALLPSVLFVGLFLVVIGIVLAAVWLKTACPSCKRWDTRRFVGRETLERKEGYKTVTRTAVSTDNQGNEVRTQYPEQIHVARYKYQNHYQCSACGHQWSTISGATREE
ncbi:MAG: hypothetical protein ACLQEQ_04645 [Nitrososphaerales archaeon]